MNKLIPLSEYVEKEYSRSVPPETVIDELAASMRRVIAYTKFLRQPLTLSMFVPADDKGNVIEKPSYKLEDYSEEEIGLGYMECDIEIYEKAAEKVLFAGFQLSPNGISIQSFNSKGLLELQIPIRLLKEYGTIEEIALRHSLPLTPSALKMIGKE